MYRERACTIRSFISTPVDSLLEGRNVFGGDLVLQRQRTHYGRDIFHEFALTNKSYRVNDMHICHAVQVEMSLFFNLLSKYPMSKLDVELGSCGSRRDSTSAAVKVSWVEKRSSCRSRGDNTAAAVQAIRWKN